MVTIADLPDEPTFTIKAVCARTGIRSVTLRAWERRYNLIAPFRSENRYRLYSERDVGILRWIKNQVDNGLSISSAVAELKAMQQAGRWPEPVPPDLQPVAFKNQAHPPEMLSKDLLKALIDHDETTAGDILREAHAVFDLTTILLGIITPTLVEIGEAWYRGDIRIATEHFASNFLRAKLSSLLQAYPTRRAAPYVLVGCAPSELHEIGGLIVSVLLRREGYRVEYLGQDLPISDLVDYAYYEHPALVILTASSETSALELAHAQEKLARIHPAPLFGFGGRAFNVAPGLRDQIPGAFLGENIEEAIAQVQKLLNHK